MIAEKYVKAFIERFNRMYAGDFEYIGGYNGCDSKVTLKCLTCGNTFTRSAQITRKDTSVRCDYCYEKVLKEKRRKKELYEAKVDERQRIKREKRADERRRKLIKECPYCGVEFSIPRRIYCSDECAKKENNQRKEITRRERVKANGYVNYSITLTEVIKRYDGVCGICGGEVDANAPHNHNDYPSIDHVIPISKGGVHMWDNIQLAHRWCNMVKSNKLGYEKGV